jgi:hypothetical protein
VQHEGFVATRYLVDGTLSNGVFSGAPGARGIFSFDQIGPLRELESSWRHAFPQSGPGTPFDVVADTGLWSYSLLSFESLAAPTPAATLEIPLSGCRTTRMAQGDGGPLFSIGTDWYSDDLPRVDFFKRSASGIEVTGGFDLPFQPEKQSLARRDGGFWYFISSGDSQSGSYAYPLDENGALAGQVWFDDYNYGNFSADYLAWRDGFFGSHREDGSPSIFVSDGYNRTDSIPIPGAEAMQGLSSFEAVGMAIGGADDSMLLVAYPTLNGIVVARFECVTPFK